MTNNNDSHLGYAIFACIAVAVFWLSIDFTSFMAGKIRDEIDHLRVRIEALEYWNGTTKQED